MLRTIRPCSVPAGAELASAAVFVPSDTFTGQAELLAAALPWLAVIPADAPASTSRRPLVGSTRNIFGVVLLSFVQARETHDPKASHLAFSPCATLAKSDRS